MRVHFPSENTQPGKSEISSRLHTPGLWRNLGLSRLERVKAHRDEFGSNLKTALDAVDEDYGRQVSTGRARIADAATMMLEALQLVRHSTEWACMEGATQDAVTAAIRQATPPAADTQVGIPASCRDEPKNTPANGDSQ